MQPTSSTIGFLIQHLALSLMHKSDQVLQEHLGIGFSQFKLLKVLGAQPHIQQRQIAEALGQTEASISRQIKLLHDKGLLQSTKSPTNRRQHITTLTSQGEQVASQAVEVLRGYHRPMYDKLTATQQQDLLAMLQTMHQQACSHNKNQLCVHFMKQ